MVNKFFKLFCAFSLCFFSSTPSSYSKDDSNGFERLDEGAVSSRAVAFNSPEAESILSNFKEKKAEQINELRSHVNVYSPSISNVQYSNLSKKEKNNLELKKLENDVEESLKNPVSEEAHQNLPHEVIMDLPDSLPKDNSNKDGKTNEGTNPRTQKIEGLISDSVHLSVHEDTDSDSHTNLRDIASRKSSYEKEVSESVSFSEAHFSNHDSDNNESANHYFAHLPSSTNSLFIAESAPLILHLENQELQLGNSDLGDNTSQSQKGTPASEEQNNPSLESEVQENENSPVLNPQIVPEEIVPDADSEQIEEYVIPEAPDFSEGVGGFLRVVSEEGFFFSSFSPEFSEESEDFTGIEDASAQCLENPADAVCQELFVAFISQPLLKSSSSTEEDGVLFENLINEENDSLMMEASLIPEQTESDSFALLSSGGNDSSQTNTNQNNKNGSDSGKNSKNTSSSGDTAAQANAQKPAVEVPLGMPDFYLPWKKAVLHDSKFIKVEAPSVQNTEPESFSKIQARVAPESSLNSVMPKLDSENGQKDSKKTTENNPLDIDFNFPLKSVFEHPIPAAFPINAIIPPQRIQVSPISSYAPVNEISTEWEIYGWFFEFCTDVYYYDWNWMIWLTQEENRFLRKLDH